MDYESCFTYVVIKAAPYRDQQLSVPWFATNSVSIYYFRYY